MTLGDIKTASKLRGIIETVSRTQIEKMRPAERIGKVYSVDYGRSVAKIWFAGDTADSLIEARFAADKIPTEAMIDNFATLGYDAPGNIVRVSGGHGQYYILDYVSGIPAIDPSARALVITNTVQIGQNVAAVEAQYGIVSGEIATLNSALDGLEEDLAVLDSMDLPGLEADLADNQLALDTLTNTTIPALNTRLTEAETDLTTAANDLLTLEGLFPITSTSIADGAVTTPKIIVNTLLGDRILANSLTAAKIVAGSITTDRFTSNTIDGNVISANTLNATKILAGSIGTDRMTANTINGDRILANTLSAGKIIAGSIDTDSMTANSINGDRITVNTLHGNRIIANTITASALNVVAGGGNLMANSSFESSPNPLAGWSKYDNAGVATLTAVVDGRRSLNAARLTWTTSSIAIVGLFRSPVGGWKANENYMVSFWAKADNTETAGGTMALAANAPAMTHNWKSNPPLIRGVYQRYIASYSRAADTNDPLFFGVAAGFGPNGVLKSVTFDDVQVEASDVVSAWAPKVDEILPGTINATMLTADAINGMTITGSLFRTAASGKRVEIFSDPGDPSKIIFHSGSSVYAPAHVLAAGTSTLELSAAKISSVDQTYIALTNNYMAIRSTNSGGTAGTVSIAGGNSANYLLLSNQADGWNAQLNSQYHLVLSAGYQYDVHMDGSTIRMYNNVGGGSHNFSSGNYSNIATSLVNHGVYTELYNTGINRACWIYGSGIYSAEGSLSIGCEVYGNLVQWSDLKDKDNLKAFGRSKDLVRGLKPSSTDPTALEVLRQLPVYDYDTKHGGAKHQARLDENGQPIKDATPEYSMVRKRGIVAQDLQKVAPHLVHDETDDPNTGFGLGVDIYGLLTTTLAALQELDEELAALKEEINQ
jgi:hypothetical protein